MSRAINVSASVAEVETLCKKHGQSISAIEPLFSGGTRVVLLSAEATDKMRRAFGKKMLTDDVVRTPLRRNAR